MTQPPAGAPATGAPSAPLAAPLAAARSAPDRVGASRWRWLAAGLLAAGAAQAATPLPPEVATALQRARVPESALAVLVEEAGSGRPLLSLNADQSMNPASLAKLVTTYAALDRLGPAWTWRTPLWLIGEVRDGVLHGSMVIRGSGDPSLVVERLWLLLRRVQQAGVREIRGDIVLDSRGFQLPAGHPADFDGEPMRPYNVRPDALMLNFKVIQLGFVPDAGAGRARVSVTPELAGTRIDRSVPLASGPCADWRAQLKPAFGADGQIAFAGSYPASCGERAWPLADPRPDSYNARLIEGLWLEMGGRLGGRVREGQAPDRAPLLEHESATLAEVVRDINKFSNNTMAQQLFLTLAAQAAPNEAATPERARAWVQQWLSSRVGLAADNAVIDNGAGLSRDTRLSAALLSRLLQQAWGSAVMPELMASLPVSGTDGTLRRLRGTPGRAHLKTGSLRDVVGLAGYVLSDSGRRYVLVVMINHAQAQAARPALEALVQWTLADGPAR